MLKPMNQSTSACLSPDRSSGEHRAGSRTREEPRVGQRCHHTRSRARCPGGRAVRLNPATTSSSRSAGSKARAPSPGREAVPRPAPARFGAGESPRPDEEITVSITSVVDAPRLVSSDASPPVPSGRSPAARPEASGGTRATHVPRLALLVRLAAADGDEGSRRRRSRGHLRHRSRPGGQRRGGRSAEDHRTPPAPPREAASDRRPAGRVPAYGPPGGGAAPLGRILGPRVRRPAPRFRVDGVPLGSGPRAARPPSRSGGRPAGVLYREIEKRQTE